MKEGKPMAFYEGVVGGRSVGAPGTVRALALAHERYGKLPWATLFEPAITLAEQGFVISPRLATLLAKDPYLAGDPDARAYFYQADGTPKTAGTRLTNPALARVLRTLASDGPDAFYRGPLAEAMVAKVHAHPTNPGVLSAADLASYRAKLRDGLCFDYRQSEICGFPTPPPAPSPLARFSACWRAGTWPPSNRYRGSRVNWPPPARPFTSTARRHASPSPIATSTWPTATSSTCR
jgi:gamma-glutamyltranspeptidase/glutathione hydrolase